MDILLPQTTRSETTVAKTCQKNGSDSLSTVKCPCEYSGRVYMCRKSAIGSIRNSTSSKSQTLVGLFGRLS